MLWRFVTVEDIGIACFKHVIDQFDELSQIELDTVLKSSLIEDREKLKSSFTCLYDPFLGTLLISSLLLVLYNVEKLS